MQRRLPHAVHAYAAIVVVLIAVSAGLGACAAVDVAGTPLAGTGYDAGAATAAQAQSNSGGTCTPTNAAPVTPLTPAQVAALPSCCTTGAAHCVPEEELPAGTEASALATCPGGACVPDALILSGGAPPPACTSLSGAAGVCLSVCVPQVAQYASLLPQATCAAQELCAPCISPLDGQSTGACDIGKSTGSASNGNSCSPGGSEDGGASSAPPLQDAGPIQCPHTGPPVLDPSSLPSCDPNGGAHCLSAALVPASEASQLATCPTGLCVPDSFIASGGEFIPATCTSILGAEGRCLDEMIPEVASQLSELPVATCQPYERCVPCYNPLEDGDGGAPAVTGACSLSCDPGPKDPPVQVQTCCKQNGTDVGDCLPTSLVPSSEQTNLSQDTCSQSTSLGTLLCVPKAMTAPGYKGTPCTAEGLLGFFSGTSYTGVCLSNCLDFGFGSGLELAQGNCNDGYTCAPCTNPLTNTPTGAPGCPSTPVADGGP